MENLKLVILKAFSCLNINLPFPPISFSLYQAYLAFFVLAITFAFIKHLLDD